VRTRGNSSEIPAVLTIAGSDPGGGAGIQADLKTFAACGVFGLSAVTAITVQNTMGVREVWPIPARLVAAQIDAVVDDFGAAATKIGMLATAESVDAVGSAIARHALQNVVLDTVLLSTSGAPLLDSGGVDHLRRVLLPLAAVVTANVPEAAALTGIAVSSVADARQAAAALRAMGARAAIVKGGHLAGPPIDVLDDGVSVIELAAERIRTTHTHGTGCTFASAIAARLAHGDSLESAARAAKAYVTEAIRHAPGLGHGRGPLAHFVS
jgi:hydroxymethylpyrimidine/phosphomethylpyrimidine kinase